MALRVSLIIPTYKPDFYLFECIDSVINQTLNNKEYEVIIALNGPFKPYKKKIEYYISRFNESNIQFISIEKSGVSNARNKALDIIKGKYIVFVDDDDIISPNYLETLLINTKSDNLVISNVKTFKKNIAKTDLDYISRNYLRALNKNKVDLLTIKSCLNTVWGKLIPQEIIADTRFNNKFSNGEDALFMFKISKNINKIILTPKTAIYYRRIRPGSATRKSLNIRIEFNNYCNLFRELLRIYFSSPLKYSFTFIASRILAITKKFIFQFNNYVFKKVT